MNALVDSDDVLDAFLLVEFEMDFSNIFVFKFSVELLQLSWKQRLDLYLEV